MTASDEVNIRRKTGMMAIQQTVITNAMNDSKHKPLCSGLIRFAVIGPRPDGKRSLR